MNPSADVLPKKILDGVQNKGRRGMGGPHDSRHGWIIDRTVMGLPDFGRD